MEVTGVVLGAVPIIIEALKAWKAVARTLRTFRSYSKEVKRIHDRLRVQQCLFDNEIESLLRSTTLDADDIQSMLDDPLDSGWTAPITKRKIVTVLAKNADVYGDLMQSILGELGALQKKLSVFDLALLAQRQPNDKLRDTVIRLKSAMQITFNKTEYEKHIEAIRDDNADLRSIRSYRYQPSTQQVVSYELPASLSKARKAVKALYEALDGSWSCADVRHVRHAAKLCLEAKVEDDVRLDLALACTSTGALPPEPLWLYVRSSTSVPPSPPASQISGSAAAASTPSCANSSNPKRIKAEASAVVPTSRDLRRSVSLCESLSQCHCLTHSEE